MSSVDDNKMGEHFRDAADKVWELAREYDERGLRELADTLRDIAVQIHDRARVKQIGE